MAMGLHMRIYGVKVCISPYSIQTSYQIHSHLDTRCSRLVHPVVVLKCFCNLGNHLATGSKYS